MIVLENEHGELTHVADDEDAYMRTLCGTFFRLVERNDSCIELMTIVTGPPTCLWCARARTTT